jgi:hypothetical protein
MVTVGVVGVDDDPPPFRMPRVFPCRRARGESLGPSLDFWLEVFVRTMRSFSFRDLARRCLCVCPSDCAPPSSWISGRFRSSPRAFESHFPGGREDVRYIVRRCSSIRYGMGGPAARGVGGEVLVGEVVSPVGDVTTVIGVGWESIIRVTDRFSKVLSRGTKANWKEWLVFLGGAKSASLLIPVFDLALFATLLALKLGLE